MKITIAIDSLKGSLTSLAAGAAIREGILRAMPAAEICVRPLADGGEGTVEALVLGMGGRLETAEVTGPVGRPVSCPYGILEEERGRTAIIEMSGAAGITLVEASERNPLNTTTYGVGEVIADAIRKGCRRFLVGIGGSATNDGGIGMLQALGFGMLDAEGQQVPFGARGLEVLAQIRTDQVMTELADCEFRIACDVSNPLCGEQGCSAVYGPQKGATPEMIRQMDAWLAAYARLAEAVGMGNHADRAGAGAAGGMGFAFDTFLGGHLEPGVQIILNETHLEDYVRDADIVVTGEGRLDSQTVMGKAPIGVAELAKKQGKKVIAFAGSVTKDATVCNAAGIDAFFPILRRISTLEEAMDTACAHANLADTAEQVFRCVAMMENR